MKRMKKQKRWLPALLLALFLVSLTGGAALAAGSYDDVSPDAWYGQAEQYVSDNGLMQGVSETRFAPEAAVTRGMIVTVLYRHAGAPAFVGKAGFSDVAEGAWYRDAVEWAAEAGLITGYGDGRFGPDDPVTREQLAVIRSEEHTV